MELHIYIPCPENILWWLICICITGVMISAAIMLQAGRFSRLRDGTPVSIQKLHIIGSAERLDGTLRWMTSASRASLRRGLRGDFLFMPFFYSLLICIGLQLHRGARPGSWEPVLVMLCYAPLLIWILDLVENVAMLGLLTAYDGGKPLSRGLCRAMAAGSALKWICGICWVIMTVSSLLAAFLGP